MAMKNKYNLALIPLCINDDVIALANKLSHMADNYLLGFKSLPHITLYQLHASEDDINSIWDKICHCWRYDPIDLTFDEFSCVTFDDEVYWVSLLPDRREILSQMHESIANAISHPVKASFDPHMTLINTREKDYELDVAELSEYYVRLKDKFVLSLGVSDDVGQYLKVIYSFN